MGFDYHLPLFLGNGSMGSVVKWAHAGALAP
jgi:hypothetical protein